MYGLWFLKLVRFVGGSIETVQAARKRTGTTKRAFEGVPSKKPFAK
jgi:hypothetical protein